MHATTVAIDLAKDVFELAFAGGNDRILERKRLSRGAFSRCLLNRPPLRVVMEACSSAHHVTNKLARRLWAMTRDGVAFDGNHQSIAPAIR